MIQFKKRKKVSKHSKSFIKSLPIKKYLVCLLLASVFSTGISFARYKTQTVGSNSFRVAQFVMEFENTFPVDNTLTLDLTDGEDDRVEYLFTITNENSQGMVCEVDVDCDLEIGFPERLPEGVTLEIYNKETSELKAHTVSSDGLTYTVKNIAKFEASTVDIYEFGLVFTAESDLLGYDFDFNDVTLKICAEQID